MRLEIVVFSTTWAVAMGVLLATVVKDMKSPVDRTGLYTIATIIGFAVFMPPLIYLPEFLKNPDEWMLSEDLLVQITILASLAGMGFGSFNALTKRHKTCT